MTGLSILMVCLFPFHGLGNVASHLLKREGVLPSVAVNNRFEAFQEVAEETPEAGAAFTSNAITSSEEGISPYVAFLIFGLIFIFARTPLKSIPPMKYLFHRRVPFFEDYSLAGGGVVLIYLGLCAAVFFSNLISQGSNYDGAIVASGKLALMNFWITLLPSSKNTMMYLITGVPFERSLKYHKLTSGLAYIAALIHACLNAAYNGDEFFEIEPDEGVVPLYGKSPSLFPHRPHYTQGRSPSSLPALWYLHHST